MKTHSFLNTPQFGKIIQLKVYQHAEHAVKATADEATRRMPNTEAMLVYRNPHWNPRAEVYIFSDDPNQDDYSQLQDRMKREPLSDILKDLDLRQDVYHLEFGGSLKFLASALKAILNQYNS